MNIVSLWHEFKRKRYLKSIDPFMKMGNGTILGDSFRLDLRHPLDGKKYLTIGDDSYIDGRFIFEIESGSVSIGNRVHIGSSSFISINDITIGNDVIISYNCLFYDHDSHSVFWEFRRNDTLQELSDIGKYGDSIKNKDWTHVNSGKIIIRDKAWIGVGCTLLKGITIGEGSVVAAGSVVTKDVPDWTLVGGNPAKVIKKLKEID